MLSSMNFPKPLLLFTCVCVVVPLFTANSCLSLCSPNNTTNDSCSILCSGDILEHVQMAGIFNDSKYFVDMKLLADPEEIKKQFNYLRNVSDLDPQLLKAFVEKWFGPPGSDIETAIPYDWTDHPSFIDHVHDMKLRNWLLELNKVWKGLLRKTPEDVQTNYQSYSSIYVPNPFVIPGGRFREIYYWDTFWIVEGLLLCQMQQTARGMIENLLYLVKVYGYVPNGSRKYYLGRSQIPFLIPLMELYYSYTGDFKFIEDNVNVLEQEYQYWVKNKLITFQHGKEKYMLFHYIVNSTSPRPESSNDFIDNKNASYFEQKHFYGDVKAAAESGFDFSSRWFVRSGGKSETIEDIYTQVIIPVDLNSLLCYNAKLLAKYYRHIGNASKSDYYEKWTSKLNYTISRLLWDDTIGFWFDYNLKTKKLLDTFYGSSFMPLWTGVYGLERNQSYVINKVIEYLMSNNLTSYPGGLPTSLVNSSQQWDYPNGWAPLQYIAILGLRDASVYNSTAGVIAEDLARKWVLNNYYSYVNSSPNSMMEKYDVTNVGVPGTGGEYPVQVGFGWSNAVVMKLLHTYPHSILTMKRSIVTQIILGVTVIVIMISAGLSYACRPNYSDEDEEEEEEENEKKVKVKVIEDSEGDEAYLLSEK